MFFIAKDQLSKLKDDGLGADNDDEPHNIGGLQVPTLNEATSQRAKNVLVEGTRLRKLGGSLTCAAGEGGDGLEDVVRPSVPLSAQYMPILSWLPTFLGPQKNPEEGGEALPRASPKADIIAGLTVAVMLVPQAMSYASLAGLPYVVGLYASLVPIAVYCLFGYSKQLAVGPVAMVSLLVAAGLNGALTEEDCPEMLVPGNELKAPKDMFSLRNARGLTCQEEYVRLAQLTCFLVGLSQIVAHLLRLDFFVHFIGHHVVSGFTSAAAILIAFSQVQYLVGYKVKKGPVHEMLGGIFADLGKFEPWPFFLGALFIATLLFSRRTAQRNKTWKKFAPMMPLTLCVIGSVFVTILGDAAEDIAIDYVGFVPDGLPPPSVSALLGDLPRSTSKVLGAAISSSLIGFMESIAIAKSIASRHADDVPAGQEMFALGMANMLGGVFGAYPVAGSFSRSAVSDGVGAKTQLSGLITACTIFVSLLALTPIFYNLPKFVLAAIVISSVLPLIAYKELGNLYKIKKADAVLWLLAFAGTLFLGVIEGITIAVGLSLVIIIMESTRPQITIMWRLPGTDIYRSVKTETTGVFVPNVLILRVGGSMYFANAGYIKESILNAIEDLALIKLSTKYVILEMTPVITMDSTAVHLILDLVRDFSARGIYVSFAAVGNRVERTMRSGKVFEKIRDNWFHDRVHTAVLYCLRHQAKKLLAQHGLHKPVLPEPQDSGARDAASSPKNRASVVASVDLKRVEVDFVNNEVKVNGERLEAPEEDAGSSAHEMSQPEREPEHTSEHLLSLEQQMADEVGFSNTLDPKYTVLNVSTSQDRVGLMADVSTALTRFSACIKRCEIDSLGVLGTRHRYLITDVKAGGKFSEELARRLCSEILEAISPGATVAPASAARGTTDVSTVLAEQVATTDALIARLQQQQEQIKELGVAAGGQVRL